MVMVNLANAWHIHPFNNPFSGTTQVSLYQKGKTNLDFTEARDSEWQWHQLGHMQVCTLLQTDNHASTPPLSFYRLDALPAAQPTTSKHWMQMPVQTYSIAVPRFSFGINKWEDIIFVWNMHVDVLLLYIYFIFKQNCYYTHLTAFSRTTWVSLTRKVIPVWI